MKALYRKYRPTKLAEVIGQEQVVESLKQSLKKGKISHAYLFTGPRGCGKTSVARIFAHEINGFKYELEDFYPDILEIDAASNTGVDNIRELRERANIAPNEGKYKVYIIDEVHMLSKSAFNALLKTLEEPPAHVIFIMATTDLYKVPSTILSRSQVYEFQLASPDIMTKHLQKIAEKEGIKITPEALELIVRRGGGSFRDSISLLDQISTLSDQEITAELVTSSLGLPEQTKMENLLSAYQSENLAEISTCLKELLNSGVRAELIAEELINSIIEKPTPDLLPLLKTLSNVSTPFPEAKLLLAFTSNLANREIPSTPIKTQPKKSPSETKPTLKKVPEPTPEPAPQPQNSNSEFSWQAFFSKVQAENPSLADILNKTSHKAADNTLILIPEKPIYKTILSSKNNTPVLKSALPENCGLKILDPKNDTVISTNDPQISKISAIMGGNVKEVKDGGSNPF